MRRCESMAIRRENFETLTRVARGRLGVQKAGFDHYLFRLATQHAEMISHRVQGSEAFVGGARSPLPRGGHQGRIREIGHGVFLCLSGFETLERFVRRPMGRPRKAHASTSTSTS